MRDSAYSVANEIHLQYEFAPYTKGVNSVIPTKGTLKEGHFITGGRKLSSFQ